MQDWSHQTLLVHLFFAFFFFFFFCFVFLLSPCRVYTQNIAEASMIHSLGTIRIFPGIYIYIYTHGTHAHTRKYTYTYSHDTLLSPFDDVHKRVWNVCSRDRVAKLSKEKRAQARTKQNIRYRSLSIVSASQKKKEKSDFSDRQRGEKCLEFSPGISDGILISNACWAKIRFFFSSRHGPTRRRDRRQI